MRISSQDIPRYLPDNPAAKIHVVFMHGGHDAFTAAPAEIRALSKEHMIAAEVTKSGRLKYAVLLVSVHAARRVQRNAQRPPLARGVVSKRRQPKGSKHWINRPDMAKSGAGGFRSMIIGLGAAEVCGRTA